MPGSYCRYCGHRCFFERVVPGRLGTLHMATCPEGKAHDRRSTGGFDADSAINPRISGQTVPGAYALAALAAAQEGTWDRARELVNGIEENAAPGAKIGHYVSGIVYDLIDHRIPHLSVKKVLIALDDPRWKRFAEPARTS